MSDALGADLLVTPFFVAHDAASIDLTVQRRPSRWAGTAPRTTPGEPRPEPDGAGQVVDLRTVDGRENLAQALLLRLLSPKGALAELGHRKYGSRLGELIGQRKTEELRDLCRAFVLEAVAQEPRVEPKAVSFDFDRLAETVSSFNFTLAVQPIGGGDPLAVSLEVEL
jgi:phage baseplate assembly protein W